MPSVTVTYSYSGTAEASTFFNLFDSSTTSISSSDSSATSFVFLTPYFHIEYIEEESPEVKEAREVREREVKEARQAAEVRANQLLEAYLGEAGYQKYLHQGEVQVDSPSKPGRRYSLDARNRIRVYEGERKVDELCIHLAEPGGRGLDNGWLPAADVVLGKLILIEYDEERLLRVANHTRY